MASPSSSNKSPRFNPTSELVSKIMRPALTSHYNVYLNTAELLSENEKSKEGIRNFFDSRQANIEEEILALSCSEASLPGSSLATHEINNDFTGVTERHVYRRQYDDRIDFTFYVDHDHKDHIKRKTDLKLIELTTNLENLNLKVEELKAIKQYNTDSQKNISKLKIQLDSEIHKISDLSDDINRLQKNILKLQNESGDVEQEKEKLKSITNNALQVLKQRGTLLEVKNIQEISQLLLKDSGIKAAIIKEYIPILNKLINRYLSIFGFNVNFILDENFNETIHSRWRDEFSYHSFSEGEKRRIDVSVLFAFRQVSELKNSANCNLLIMDEIVDSSLDLNSREAFLEILNSEKGNTFVISHTAPSYDAFEAVIKAEKQGDFSTYEFIS